MADVICDSCGENSGLAYCHKCYEAQYNDGYEKGKEDAIAEASEIKQ